MMSGLIFIASTQTQPGRPAGRLWARICNAVNAPPTDYVKRAPHNDASGAQALINLRTDRLPLLCFLLASISMIYRLIPARVRQPSVPRALQLDAVPTRSSFPARQSVSGAPLPADQTRSSVKASLGRGCRSPGIARISRAPSRPSPRARLDAGRSLPGNSALPPSP